MLKLLEEKHTYRIIHSRYQPKTKIDDIYQEILYANPAYHSELLETYLFPKTIYNFLIVYEWLAFEEYEDFHTALSVVSSVKMFDVLENELSLTELARILKSAKQKIDKVISQSTSNLENYVKQMNKIRATTNFQQQETLYQEQKPFIYAQLLDYTIQHISDFP